MASAIPAAVPVISGGSSASKPDKKSGKSRDAKSSADGSNKEMVATAFVSIITVFLITYAFHCVWATSEAYSSPSIVLSARSHDGNFPMKLRFF